MIAYQTYIRSERWRAIRNTKAAVEGWHCEWCGRDCSRGQPMKPNVHHLHYQTLGRESLEDLQLLCRRCHATITFCGELQPSVEGFFLGRRPLKAPGPYATDEDLHDYRERVREREWRQIDAAWRCDKAERDLRSALEARLSTSMPFESPIPLDPSQEPP